MEFIDSHAHLSGPEFLETIDSVLLRAQEAGVTRIINICTDQDSLSKGLELAKKHPWIYNTAATTPHDVENEGEALFPVMEHHARKGDLVAIGETGLDYYYEHSPKKTQRHIFIKYLHLALECCLPVVIHCRNAFKDFFEIIDAEYCLNERPAPGVLHCFTGTLEEAKQVIERGWYLSLSGIVTFKKSEELREIAKIIPLSQLLIETDAPYLAPQSKRGKSNEPSFLPEIAEIIATVKNLPLESVAKATAENARQLFKLSSL